MCGHPDDWIQDDLLSLLSLHGVSSLLDARPMASTVPLVRRSCTAQGIAYEVQPSLGAAGPGTDAGAKAALLARLAGLGHQAAAGGPRPCVLFSGEAWRLCKSRCQLGDELQARGVQVFHIAWGSGKLEPHRGGTPAVPSSSPSAQAPLQVSVIPPKNGVHVGTLVYLHALGFGTAPYLNQMQTYAMDGMRIVLPSAPQLPVARYGGRPMLSWYGFAGGGGGAEEEVNESSLAETRAQLFDIIDSEAQRLGVDGRSRLLLGGISQGCSAALDVAMRARDAVGGFVGIAGHALRCTPPDGPSRMALHFFFGMQVDDGSSWHFSEQTLSRFRAHHDVKVCGPFPTVGRYVPAATEAEWVRSVCRGVVDTAAAQAAAAQSAAAQAAAAQAAEAIPSTLPAAAAAPQAPVFEVLLQKAAGAALGLQLDCTDPTAPRIKAVSGGSAVAWNAAHPGREVKAGDRVLEVNGIRGNATQLVHECRTGRELRMKLQRGGEAAAQGPQTVYEALGEAAALAAGVDPAAKEPARLPLQPKAPPAASAHQPRLVPPPRRAPGTEPPALQAHLQGQVLAPRSKARPPQPDQGPAPPSEPPPERLLQEWGQAVPEEAAVVVLSDEEEQEDGRTRGGGLANGSAWPKAQVIVDTLSVDEAAIVSSDDEEECVKRRRLERLEL